MGWSDVWLVADRSGGVWRAACCGLLWGGVATSGF
jgi:hypothetical protein